MRESQLENSQVADGARGDAQSGEGESKRSPSKPSLWRALVSVFEGDGDPSLRDQIAEAIDEHEAECTHENHGDLTRLERDMLRNMLRFGHRDAGDVAIPRGEIIALPESASWEELTQAFAEHGHSRLPVYRDSLDTITGMVLLKDVFPYLAAGTCPAGGFPRQAESPDDSGNTTSKGVGWHSLLRQPLFVPQARPALDVLADMRAKRVHLAVVVDEYSGTDGIVTFEDLIEEIIGEIEDEHDDAPEDQLKRLANGCWDADARVRLEDVAARIDPRLGEVEEAVDTLGGLAFVLAEAVPPVGARLAHASGWMLEVTGADARHVTRLRLHPPAPGGAG